MYLVVIVQFEEISIYTQGKVNENSKGKGGFKRIIV